MEEQIIYIDSENLAQIVEKLNLYINEENDLINDIKESFNRLKENYVSTNSNLLEQLQVNDLANLNKMKLNHDSNIFLINVRIEHVREKVRIAKAIDDSASKDGIVKNE